jgi:hypothetical protein
LAQRALKPKFESLESGYSPPPQVPDLDAQRAGGCDYWARGCDRDVERKELSQEVRDPFGIEVQPPDEFAFNQLMLEKLTALAALKRMRERWALPQYDSIALVALLEKRGLPQTAAHLRDVVGLIYPAWGTAARSLARRFASGIILSRRPVCLWCDA